MAMRILAIVLRSLAPSAGSGPAPSAVCCSMPCPSAPAKAQLSARYFSLRPRSYGSFDRLTIGYHHPQPHTSTDIEVLSLPTHFNHHRSIVDSGLFSVYALRRLRTRNPQGAKPLSHCRPCPANMSRIMPLKNPDIDTGRNEKPSRSDGMRAPANFKDPIRGKPPDSFFTVGGSQDIPAKINRAARTRQNPSR